MGDWIYRNRLKLLLTCVAVYYLLQVSNGLWVEDFWDHAAAVSALMRDLIHPRHAQLAIEQPHAFFTPYSVLVACVARLASLSAVEALALFGLVNGALLVVGLWRYLRAMNVDDVPGALFYSILCILFLWGSDRWDYSGFFHVGILKFVLPYPSAFATGLAFIGLALTREGALGLNLRTLVVLAILWVVMLTHPVAFVLMGVGLFADAITRPRRRGEAILMVAIVGFAAVALSMIWPYYPFIRLSTGAANVYHASNGAMYVNVLGATWPVVLALAFAGRTLADRRNRALVVTASLLLVLYGLAWWLQKFSFGRVIGYVVLLCHLVIGQQLALWDRALFRSPTTRRFLPPVVVIALAIFGHVAIQSALTRGLTAANSLIKGRPLLHRMSFGHLEFVRDKVEPGSVVLANVNTSWIIPTFGAKVVALLHPHAFVEDLDRRAEDVEAFFASGHSADARRAIIDRYGVRYLLVSKSRDAACEEIVRQFKTEASLIYEDSESLLIRVAPSGLESIRK